MDLNRIKDSGRGLISDTIPSYAPEGPKKNPQNRSQESRTPGRR
jgi:hypothetical protein